MGIFPEMLISELDSVQVDRGQPTLAMRCVVFFRGRLHNTAAPFVPARAHPGSFLWLCICFHDITKKCRTCARSSERESHPGTKSRNGVMKTKNDHSFRPLYGKRMR